MRSVTPYRTSQATTRSMTGGPGTGSDGLARSAVSGRSRVPRPAARTSAESGADRTIGPRLRLVEEHVGGRQPVRAAVFHEQRPVRVEEEVVRRSPERAR